jgi:hypothetical protein
MIIAELPPTAIARWLGGDATMHDVPSRRNSQRPHPAIVPGGVLS